MIENTPKLSLLFVLLLFCSAVANACVCVTIGQPDGDVRQYFQESFKGSVFTGKIRSIRDLPRDDKSGEVGYPPRELLIDVELYWLGVETPEIKAYTIGANTSCTMDWEKDVTLFFIARRQPEGLHVGMCDLSSWRGRFPDKEWSDVVRKNHLRLITPGACLRHNGCAA